MPTTELKRKMSYLLFFDVLHLLYHGTMKKNSKSVRLTGGGKEGVEKKGTLRKVL